MYSEDTFLLEFCSFFLDILPLWKYFCYFLLLQILIPPNVSCLLILYLFLYLFFILIFYLFIHERHRERQRQQRQEKQAPCKEPHMGLDPGTLGSHPELKSDTQPLSHPSISCVYFLKMYLCIREREREIWWPWASTDQIFLQDRLCYKECCRLTASMCFISLTCHNVPNSPWAFFNQWLNTAQIMKQDHYCLTCNSSNGQSQC